MRFQLSILLFALLLTVPAGASSLRDAEEVILEKAERAIEQIYGNKNMRVQLRSRWIPGSIRNLNSGSINSVKPLGALKKYTRFRVSYVERGITEEAEIQLSVEMEMKLPVLTQRMQRGEEIEADDLTWKWVGIDLNRDQPIKNSNDLIGQTLRRSLNAGDFIQGDEIGMRYLVQAGEMVRMTYQQNALQIVLNCESRQDGAIGEEIKVYCKETRQRFQTEHGRA